MHLLHQVTFTSTINTRFNVDFTGVVHVCNLFFSEPIIIHHCENSTEEPVAVLSKHIYRKSDETRSSDWSRVSFHFLFSNTVTDCNYVGFSFLFLFTSHVWFVLIVSYPQCLTLTSGNFHFLFLFPSEVQWLSQHKWLETELVLIGLWPRFELDQDRFLWPRSEFVFTKPQSDSGQQWAVNVTLVRRFLEIYTKKCIFLLWGGGHLYHACHNLKTHLIQC